MLLTARVCVYGSGFQPGGRDPRGGRLLFLGVARASDENIHNSVYTLHCVCGTTFCRIAKIV